MANDDVRTDDAASMPSPPGQWSEVWNHTGTVLAAAASGVVAVRLIRISHGDVDTAYELLRSSGSATVLLSLAVDVVPTFALIATAVYLVYLPSLTQAKPSARTAALYGVLVLLLSVVPLQGLVFLVVGVLGGRLARRVSERTGRGRAGRGIDIDYVGIGTALLVLVVVVYPDRPWLPSESITVKGREPIAAYVLSEQDGQLRVLIEQDRRIEILGATDVVARSICRIDRASSRSRLSLINLAASRPDYPPCPD